MTAPVLESALVVLAPAAEPLVKDYRDQFDPSAALGVPAHVTVLYPFQPPVLSPAVMARLAALFAEFAPFDYSLTELRRFPNVLYLAPHPDAPFRALTGRVALAFPDFPPYGGKYADIVPHLTVAQLADADQLENVAAQFHTTCGPRLPLALRAEAVALMDNDHGGWQLSATFRLGL